jgi:dethiobiotin synthetase
MDRPGRLTRVEGAGGLLVTLASAGVTLRDIAVDLGAPVLVVCEPGLGTLNHTALTLEALDRAGLTCAGLVIGRWPENPGVVELSNRDTLAELAPVRAVLPDGAGSLTATEFATLSSQAFGTAWVAGLV